MTEYKAQMIADLIIDNLKGKSLQDIWFEIEKRIVITAFQKGGKKSTKEIAESIGMKRSALVHMRKRHGLPMTIMVRGE